MISIIWPIRELCDILRNLNECDEYTYYIKPRYVQRCMQTFYCNIIFSQVTLIELYTRIKESSYYIVILTILFIFMYTRAFGIADIGL